MRIERGIGSLLDATTDAVVNTVNTVGVMGKGVALQFRQAYPDNYKAYQRAHRRDELAPGKMLVVPTGKDAPRFIINFPTKRHWRENSRVEDIESGLRDLVDVIKQWRIKSISLPPLGCGNGGLDWADVRPRIERALGAVEDLRVVLFEPGASPSSEQMAVGTKRPRMTANRAALVEVIRRYREADDYRQTKVEVQKSAYFLEVAGQPFRLAWVQHNFGPYAEKLNHVLRDLEGHYIRGFGDRSRESTIRVLPDGLPQVESQLAHDTDSAARVALVRKLIDRYEFPYGMELLASVHWVATHDLIATTDVEATTRLVHAWNTRKAAWPTEHIRSAWERLGEQGWFDRRLAA